MKRITAGSTIFAVLVLASLAWAAVPQTISYQGYLRNTDGTPVNTQVNVVFSLYTASSGGSAVWTQTQSVTPANGVYSVLLGGGSTPSPIPASVFANDTLYLGIKVGSDAEMTPRQQLTTTPYAFRAGTADSVAAGGVVSSSLAAGSVASSALAENSVTPAKLADGAVTTEKLADGAVTTGKLNTGSVTSAKLNIDADFHMNKKDIFLREGTDAYHGLGWYGAGKLFATQNVDGPVLYGWSGGALGTTNGGQKTALSWDNSGNVSVAGQVESQTGGIKFPDGTVQTTASAPTWSQKIPGAARWTLVLDDAAVLDKETGLVWERSTDSTRRVWNDALNYCNYLNLGGRWGWRLPSVEELASLLDTAQTSPPYLPAGHPFTGTLADNYWTSSTLAGNSDHAWCVCFGWGYVNDYTKSTSELIRCVRGGK